MKAQMTEICGKLGEVARQSMPYSEEQLAEIAEAFDDVRAALEAIAEIMQPIVEAVIEAAKAICERMQRIHMYHTGFPAWVPNRVAMALSEHWPRQWLPPLNLGGA